MSQKKDSVTGQTSCKSRQLPGGERWRRRKEEAVSCDIRSKKASLFISFLGKSRIHTVRTGLGFQPLYESDRNREREFTLLKLGLTSRQAQWYRQQAAAFFEFFETLSYSQGWPQILMLPRMFMNSWSFCLYLLSARIIGTASKNFTELQVFYYVVKLHSSLPFS